MPSSYQRRHPPSHTPPPLHNAVIRPRTHRHPTQRRHTARSRSIHSGVQRALDFLGGALAGGDGFCDCAQNDEVWGAAGASGMRRSVSEHGDAVVLPTPSSALAHTVTPHNAVILREVAVSIVACRGRWIFWGVRWQAGMDSATARRMTKFGCSGHFGNDEVGVQRALWG